MMIILFSILGTIGLFIAVAVFSDWSSKPQRNANKRQREISNRKSKNEDEKKMLLSFYQKVSENIDGITKDNAEEYRETLELINDNYNYVDPSSNIVAAYYRAHDCYFLTEKIKEELAQKEEMEKKQDEHEKYIDKLTNIIDNQEFVASLVGKDKYLDLLNKRLKEIRKKKSELATARAAMTQLTGIMAASGPALPQNKTPELDWKTSALAGAASAVGGPLAGMMVISDSLSEQASKNVHVDKAEAYRKHSAWVSKTMTPAMTAADKQLSQLNENGIVNKINAFDYLIDMRNQEEKKKSVHLNVLGYKVKTPYEFYIDIKISTDDVEIIGKPAKVDGSYKVSVRDQGKEVAHGFLSGQGYGITDINSIGFGNNEYRLVCYSPNGELKKDKEYKISLQAKNIWYIEDRTRS